MHKATDQILSLACAGETEIGNALRELKIGARFEDIRLLASECLRPSGHERNSEIWIACALFLPDVLLDCESSKVHLFYDLEYFYSSALNAQAHKTRTALGKLSDPDTDSLPWELLKLLRRAKGAPVARGYVALSAEGDYTVTATPELVETLELHLPLKREMLTGRVSGFKSDRPTDEELRYNRTAFGGDHSGSALALAVARVTYATLVMRKDLTYVEIKTKADVWLLVLLSVLDTSQPGTRYFALASLDKLLQLALAEELRPYRLAIENYVDLSMPSQTVDFLYFDVFLRCCCLSFSKWPSTVGSSRKAHERLGTFLTRVQRTVYGSPLYLLSVLQHVPTLFPVLGISICLSLPSWMSLLMVGLESFRADCVVAALRALSSLLLHMQGAMNYAERFYMEDIALRLTVVHVIYCKDVNTTTNEEMRPWTEEEKQLAVDLREEIKPLCQEIWRRLIVDGDVDWIRNFVDDLEKEQEKKTNRGKLVKNLREMIMDCLSKKNESWID